MPSHNMTTIEELMGVTDTPFDPPASPLDQLTLHRMQEAYDAALCSTHPNTQVGAFLSTGHRGFNRQYDDAPPSDHPEWSLVHAETDAILNAAYFGASTSGETLYAPWACCCNCASVIIAAGVERVVVHKERMMLTPDKWDSHVRQGLAMLIRNEVYVESISWHFGVTLRVDGQEVTV